MKPIQKVAPEALVGVLLGANAAESATAGLNLLRKAGESGLSLPAYLSASCDPKASADARLHGLDPMTAVFAHLQLPTTAKTEVAVAQLAASTDSFTTNPGLRILMPTVIENLLREQGPIAPVENVADIVSQTRDVAGDEVITKSTWSGTDIDTFESFMIAEGSQIPKRSITATQSTVRFYKHGSALELSYEAARRLSPNMLVPYAAKMERERLRTRAAAAAYTLLNGDSGHGAITSVNLSTFGATAGSGLAKNATAFIKFLIDRAKRGVAIDTILGNYDTVVELMTMFPVANGPVLATGANGVLPNSPFAVTLPGGLNFSFRMAVSSQVPEGSLIAFDKSSTLEELRETGSAIREQEQSITNQMITYVNTLNSGFKFAVDESRILLNWLL